MAVPTTVLILGPMPHDYIPSATPKAVPHPQIRSHPVGPCSSLHLAPGSAVTYTAERYSYGRMGQKET